MADHAPARVRSAIALASYLVDKPWQPVAAAPRERRRRVAIGDPQTTLEKLLRILDEHGLLGDDGRLDPDVQLLSIGDHFDFDGGAATPETIGQEGRRVVRWLAEHPPDQVVLLLGNHDTSRVMELAFETDESFARARALAQEAEALRKQTERTPAEDLRLQSLRDRFAREHARIPTIGVAARDYMAFAEGQRRLVQALLVAGRFRLAATGTLGGRPILLTHAAVTVRELGLLGIPGERDATAIARRLNAALDAAVADARAHWEKDEPWALDLGELHVGGRDGLEGGGLLYHRPVNPANEAAAKEPDAVAPRRYDPLDLPRGLLQVCGHTGHRKSRKDLRGFLTASADGFIRGGLRTLRSEGPRFVYEAGIVPVPADERGLHMIDAEMNHVHWDAYPVVTLNSIEWGPDSRPPTESQET
jgi:hypothetical protein